MTEYVEEAVCGVCGAAGPFIREHADSSLRETVCPNCNASHRTRNVARSILLAAGLDTEKPLVESLDNLTHLDILELAGHGPLHNVLRALPGYRCCEFSRPIRSGDCTDAGVLCQDITTLTFASASFDIVINQDILECLADPWPAFAEVGRVLRPGGRHIFTIPMHEGLAVSRQRARKTPEGEVIHLEPPVVQGDPLTASESLVYWDFGQDIIPRLASLGISAREAVSTRFYAPSDVSDLSDPEQYRRYMFFRKRDMPARAFRYNATTYMAEASQQDDALYLVRYTPETDMFQIQSASSLHSLSERGAKLVAVRSETVNWGGRAVQMADITLQDPDARSFVIMLVNIYWGDFPTFIFPERFSADAPFIETVAQQLYDFFRKLTAMWGQIPLWFQLDGDCQQLTLASGERNCPGLNTYYTTVAHFRRYNFVLADKDFSRETALDIGCGMGYGLNMLNPVKGLGVDISEEALQHAAASFPQPSLSWRQEAIETLHLGATFDTVTCFEVMEHLTDHLPLLDAMTEHLNERGTLYVSIPSPKNHGKDLNPFHLRDYELHSLQALFLRYFADIEWFHQDDDSGNLQRVFQVKPGALPEHEFWIAKCKRPRKGAARKNVSIVMPLHNKWDDTRRALDALTAHTPAAHDWELILIDNASTDETPEALRSLAIDAVIHTNTENLGFVKACNQGALLARGDYVVFLDNETEVQPGWLAALLHELEAHPQTGIAGGKLLYPDGTIHHAGMAIGPDQLPYHIHRHKPADDALVNERREFSVISCACAAVRRVELLELGMFDEDFVNGYEDTDLCIRYRRHGQQCVYRPDCVVIRHESGKEDSAAGLSQDLARTFKKWRYDLVQDDFQYKVRLADMAHPAQPMRFAIKIGVPQRGITGWGDVPYAECLAKELIRAGHSCVIHYLSEWGDEDRDIDVVIHLKGLSEYYPKPWNYNIMWMLNHPEMHTKEELERYDAVFVSSIPYAEELAKPLAVPVRPLLQATDPECFKPISTEEKCHDLVFVGNNNGSGRLDMRKMVEWLLPTRHSLAVYGRGWEGLLPKGVLKDQYVAWEELANVYSSARIVLNDHQPSMADHGFINNRTFDALACGAVVVSDRVRSCADVLAIPQCDTRESLNKSIDTILENPAGAQEKAAALREEVLAKHTFAQRVAFIENFVLGSKTDTRVWERIDAARLRIADPAYRCNGPLVSVLMATYNRRQFLKTALESVINQTYTNWELWLVNDGGPDVADIVASLNDPRIYYLNLEKNSGKGHAMNVAFRHSKGAYIAYNDDDDRWLPDHLERLMLAVREMPGIDMAYSDAARVTLQCQDDEHYTEQDYELCYQRQVTLDDMMEYNAITGLSVLHTRELLETAGAFDERLKALIDFDMWKRLTALAYPYHVSRITAEYYIRGAIPGAAQITTLAERDPFLYRKQRIRIMRKRLPLPDNSPYHAYQEELFRKNLFEYFVCICQKVLEKNDTRLFGTFLSLADAYKTFSLEGLRALALCVMNRKLHTKALGYFEEFIHSPGVTPTDLFYAYVCALEARSKNHARTYATRIAAMHADLGPSARDLFVEYNRRFVSLFSEEAIPAERATP